MPSATLGSWLEGRDGHPPVIRPEKTGSQSVTWGEFVEAGWLRAYRKRQVSLQHLRVVIDQLRESFGVPYPLAHFKPYVGEGRRLMLEAQTAAGLAPEDSFVLQIASGQLVLDGRLKAFVDSIDFSDDDEQWAQRMHPQGRSSPVVIDPEFSFGAPSVEGIRTEVLAELIDAGEPPEVVADEYELELAAVHAATAYEWRPAAA